MRATFQIILKKPVFPQIYLAHKMFKVVRDLASVIGDFAFEQVNQWISIKYYTAYEAVQTRNVVGFTVELPSEINEVIGQRIIEGDPQDKELESFGTLLQADTEFVEAVLRYEDDGLVADINKYHPEIFELEMKLREVLNYILCYNLKNHDIFDFLRDFKEINIKSHSTNKKIADFKKKKKTDKSVKHPFSYYFENELFHLVVSDYKGFTKPYKRDLKALKSKVEGSKSLEEVKTWLKQAVDFSKLNEEHKLFISNVGTRINPIENLRNDIMHNRRIPLETANDFERAKQLVSTWIDEFWQKELSPEENRFIEPLKQAEYLLDTLIASVTREDKNSSYFFRDLDFEILEADIKEELKSYFLDIITYRIQISDQTRLEEIVDTKLAQIA